MPLQQTSGNVTTDAYGGGVAVIPTYIEQIFSTYLYTGNGSTQTITNGIDLSTKGGMVWEKTRTTPGFSPDNMLFDTLRGPVYPLYSNSTAAPGQYGSTLTAFNTNGFTVGGNLSQSGVSHVSWTFRKQPKFFDVVTYTGTGSNTTIAHNLGSVPGCIFVKRTDTTADWQVYHRSLANTQYMVLNTNAGPATGATRWNSTTPTASVFSLGTDATVNASGGTYVAYIYAHNAGGFGLSGTDDVISCGSYVGNGSALGQTVTLGYEPQWLMVKRADGGGGYADWYMFDNMRGIPTGGADSSLSANSASAETTALGNVIDFTATGFSAVNTTGILNSGGSLYLYIAIRRGPMKVPTDGTKVFAPVATSAATGTKLTTNFPVDLQIFSLRSGTTNKNQTADRLRGVSTNATEGGSQLITSSTAAETTNSIPTLFWDNTGFQMPSSYGGTSEIFWNFRRAPGFFDVVCYTGTGSNRTVAHNLTAVPELMIVKPRNSVVGWVVYSAASGPTKYQYLNMTDAVYTYTPTWNDTAPTSSVFTVGTDSEVNASGGTFVSYLFATCPGVSKVGSYTGTGTTQTINCGFTGGARFVLLKRTDSTGDWYVWDTARGMVSGTDPSLLLNSTAAEVNANSIYTTTGGFQIVSTAAGINASGGTYIYLSIA